jgi:hypothetical protein
LLLAKCRPSDRKLKTGAVGRVPQADASGVGVIEGSLWLMLDCSQR